MHESFMQRCFQLAQRGVGQVSPNPLVGAVIVKNGQIIGEGFHQGKGLPHAEPNAFASTSGDVAGATLYVNLEPCCHTAKLTPPCVPLIIQKKISHVVVSNIDPHPQVSGQGLKALEAAGIKVTSGILAPMGEELNEIFFHRMRTGNPFVHLKTAASLDGKTSLPNGESQWLTNELARDDAHHGRLRHDAIVIGAETLRKDNPKLTVRIPGLTVQRPPWRIVLTRTGQLPFTANLFTDELRHRTLVVTDLLTPIHVVPAEQVIRLKQLAPFPFSEFFQHLAAFDIYSLWLEGGSMLQSLFLAAGQVQRLTLYLAPKIMGAGTPMFQHPTTDLTSLPLLQSLQLKMLGQDIKITGRLP